jgi:tRNA U34 5-carboxymethylaminomethyl modifying GTPase MnmE/TrmE
MFKINNVIEPPSKRIRNIVKIREKLSISTTEATNLYDGLLNKNIKKLDEKVIDSLIQIGWKITFEDDNFYKIKKEEMIEFSKNADSWYNNLSGLEKKYVAYFQRMMIPNVNCGKD